MALGLGVTLTLTSPKRGPSSRQKDGCRGVYGGLRWKKHVCI